MVSFLKKEVDLLGATVASDAMVEVVPAPGVRLLGSDGIRTDWGSNGTLKIPLGALFAGQHREALVHVHVDPARFEGAQRAPLASASSSMIRSTAISSACRRPSPARARRATRRWSPSPRTRARRRSSPCR